MDSTNTHMREHGEVPIFDTPDEADALFRRCVPEQQHQQRQQQETWNEVPEVAYETPASISQHNRNGNGEHERRDAFPPVHESTPQTQQHPRFQSSFRDHNLPHIYRPIPRRNFSSAISTNTISSTAATAGDSSDSPRSPPPGPSAADPPASELKRANSSTSDFLAQINARLLRTKNGYSDRLGGWDGDTDDGGGDTLGEYGEGDGNSGIKKSQSFLNAKSTLFGIMGEGDSIPDSPWGVGSETPGFGLGFGIGFDETDTTTGHQHQHQLRYGEWFDSSGSVVKSTSPLSTRSPLSARSGPQRRTLSRRTSSHVVPQRRGFKRYATIVGKLLSLFAFGAVYGVIVSHLHDARELAAVNVGGVARTSWKYIAGWGLAGLVFGTMLPWVDAMTNGGEEVSGEKEEEKGSEADQSNGEKLNELLRSVAAFAGIAFAIRRLPWESTLQLTITLALVNPALWYILDRTRNGLSFSLIATSIITSFIFLSFPDVLPSPVLPATSVNGSSVHIARPGNGGAGYSGGGGHGTEELFAGMVTYENLATAIWVGSVIFCSCICFGGIGRRSGLLDEWGLGR